MGGTYLIQSVPAELNMDHTVVLQLAEVLVCLLRVCVCARTCKGQCGRGFWSTFDLLPITQVFLLELSNGYTTQTCAYFAVIY